MNLLLTGHEGFIGQNIYNELWESDTYTGITLVGKDYAKVLLDNPDMFDECVSELDVILHNGAISDTSNEDYHEVLYYNYHFTKKLIDLSKKYGVKMVFASSASIYGNDNSTLPQNIYAWSKLMSEHYGRAEYPDGFTALRYFNVYGPHEEHKIKMASVGLQSWLFKYDKIQPNKPFPFKLFPKEPKRDFVYVDDVVSANLAAIEAPSGVYDVGSGVARSFEDFVSNMGVEYIHISEDWIPEWYQFFTESNKDKWLPNWKPSYNLEEGCKSYLKYLEDE